MRVGHCCSLVTAASDTSCTVENVCCRRQKKVCHHLYSCCTGASGNSTKLVPWRRAKSNWRQNSFWTSGIQTFNQQLLVERFVCPLAMISWVSLTAQRISNNQLTSAWCMKGLWGAQLPRIDASDLSFSAGCVQHDSQRITINTQLLTLN